MYLASCVKVQNKEIKIKNRRKFVKYKSSNLFMEIIPSSSLLLCFPVFAKFRNFAKQQL
jgi:hypothetical protein